MLDVEIVLTWVVDVIMVEAVEIKTVVAIDVVVLKLHFPQALY